MEKITLSELQVYCPLFGITEWGYLVPAKDVVNGYQNIIIETKQDNKLHMIT